MAGLYKEASLKDVILQDLIMH